ncbi:multidrug efflux SMR transporter [Actinocorallia sp. A-T 12471]|uniref:DMT family transporter n=1 Tax=Actinocorallia sp. A-T 12471 TaxID=3089813 RepID=UPI0029D36142|nr:multidrug efflux SMR transporter [Actinocorallia sp. A-T 12471]MDX6744801.1 multidrug efflux SMR transporter [Actinocorallia sp. A-T 12471]
MVMYLYLAGAIVSEVVATSLLKSTDGFSKLLPTLVCLAGYGLSFVLLAQGIARGLQVGVAYAIWAGAGTALIAAIGVLFLNEPVSAAKVAGVALVIGGVVTLNLSGAH